MNRMKMRTLIEYILAAIIVLILGGLAGWYFFLRTQTQTTSTQSAARGFGAAIPEGNANGTSPFSGISGASPSSSEAISVAQRPPQLWQVAAEPIAGQAFVGSGNDLRLRYVERASGYVFEADPETGTSIRRTNTLLPKIYEALLTGNGHVYERSIDAGGAITTFVGTIATSTDASSASSSSQTLLGAYLAKDIASMSADPRTGALFYIERGASGVSGVTADWNGGKQKTIFTSTIMHWQPTVLEDGRIILVQAAADSVPGYAYELKKDGTQSLLLGPLPGLTMRARASSGALLWSQSARGIMSLFVRVDQNSTGVQLPIKTLADKCAWAHGKDPVAYCGVPQGSAGQNFLDVWYRGAAHSSDALWRIDASAGTAEMIYTPPSDTSIDVENMLVDSGGNYITFMNAANKSLWLLRLSK